MRSTLTVVAIVCCFVGAVGLTWKILAHPIPAKGELMSIEGVVREVASGIGDPKTRTENYPVLHLVGRTGIYRYLDWFPTPQRIPDRIRAGDRVRLLSDTPNGNRWIWQLEKEGAMIVSYEEVYSAVRANRAIDPYLAAALFFAAAFGTVKIIRMRQNA